MKCRWNAEKIPIPIRYRSDTDQIPIRYRQKPHQIRLSILIPVTYRNNSDQIPIMLDLKQDRGSRKCTDQSFLGKRKGQEGSTLSADSWPADLDAPQETLAWLTPIEYRLNTNDMPMKRRGKPHTDTIPIKYRSDTDQIPIKYRWKPPIKYVCRYNTHNIPKQLRSNTD